MCSQTKRHCVIKYTMSTSFKLGRLMRIELTNVWFTARCVNHFTTTAKCFIILLILWLFVKDFLIYLSYFGILVDITSSITGNSRCLTRFSSGSFVIFSYNSLALDKETHLVDSIKVDSLPWKFFSP